MRLGDVSHNAHTYASGLRMPKAFADYLILAYVRVSGRVRAPQRA